ncbi:DNA repair protein RecO [Sphingobacterium hungaricum]|uniref:DNA repair protein RecO n=1 Tax=Sphingobacterium hungaricum TaxID=2082723 RepID=A0A928UX70_9SPHI|nr:DNA repair protein RecO [Sphingobacterium hungaricum]MBE8712985.1 DNA repair protein RecO [Sphingobacterium hungaricum]
MLHKTTGIALKNTNYSENSIVSQIYTEKFGLQSYLINGAKKPKAKIHINMLQPLHLVEMVVYYKDNSNLQRIKEAQQTPLLREIPMDIVKSSLAIFLNEILYKVLRHQNSDPQLFQFLYRSILWLDQSKSPLGNFHLVFLLKLSRYLGFEPTKATNKVAYFDLFEGVFTQQIPSHTHVLHQPYSEFFLQLISVDFEQMASIKISHDDRIYLLEKIIDFYKLHTENFGEVKSLYVLEELFK